MVYRVSSFFLLFWLLFSFLGPGISCFILAEIPLLLYGSGDFSFVGMMREGG